MAYYAMSPAPVNQAPVMAPVPAGNPDQEMIAFILQNLGNVASTFKGQSDQAKLAEMLTGTPGSIGAGTTFAGSPELGGQANTGTAGLLGDMDPRVVEAALLMPGGVEALMGAALQRSLPQEPRAPIKAGPGDVFLDPSTLQPVASVPGEVEAPPSRDILRGDRRIFQEFDRATGQWVDIGEGPAFRPPDSINIDTGGKTGPIPAGMALRQMEDGSYVLEEIPGGPAEQERLARERGEAGATERAHTKSDVVGVASEQALELLEEHGNWAAGAGSWLSGMPGSAALELRTHLDTIRANVSFSELVKIKEQGGSLGALSDTELALLGSLLGSLDQGLPPAMLANNIRQIDTLFGKVFQDAPAAAAAAAGGSGIAEGTIIDNPETGESMVLRNGAWEPL